MKFGLRGRLFVAATALGVLSITATTYLGPYPASAILGVLLWGAFLLASQTGRALEALENGATRMAQGNLSARIPPLGKSEMGHLGQTLNALASGLSETLEDLRLERDRLDNILSSMDEGVLFLDEDGRVVLMNRALREMLLLQGEVAGRRLLEVIRHADLKELIDTIEPKTTLSGDSTQPLQAYGEIQTAGLSPKTLLVRASQLVGSTSGLVVVFVDVTETRRLEALRREFVANVSHELRTPVTTIRSAAETLHLTLETDLGMAAKFTDIIDRNATRLQTLVEDLLDLSRIESRKYSLSLVPVRLGEFFQNIARLQEELAQKRRVTVKIEVPDGLPPVRADRNALERVLTNLVDNAIKYAGEGRQVVLRAEPSAGQLLVSVIDNGPGIEERHLSRIFERFYRVDAGRSRDVGGTGLGLSIVKHLVESMGGSVGVESQVGRGTQFLVRLPLAVTPSTS